MLNLDKNKKYLLACSFGPDSMALFDMLKQDGINFVVAHVNYGVRKEAKAETNALNHYCAIHDIQIEILYAKPIKNGDNFEAKAREIRYNFFKEICVSDKIDILLVAHQQDDVLETYFLQRQRGGFVEYYGIKPETTIFGMEVVRPLLDYSKAELENYCIKNDVPYAIDSSNLSNDFARNVIRHTIVSKMNPRERKSTLDNIRELNEEIDLTYKKLSDIDGSSKGELLHLNDDEFQRMLVIMAREIQEDASISAPLSLEIRKILRSNKPNVTLRINDTLSFVKEYDYVNFKGGPVDCLFEYKIDKPKIMDNKYFYLNFLGDTSDRNVTLDDYPLMIRNASSTDSIMINNYRVEARRLFIDWKMPLSVRKKWPVIVNKNNKVIYIPRYRKDFQITKDLNFYVKK